MRLKITLTLIAILLGLLTYIVYIDPDDDDDSFARDKTNVLGDIAVGIDYLSIRNPTSGQVITLEHDGKNWLITEPYNWPANEFAVESILTQLRFLKSINAFETSIVSSAGASLADYGLAPAELSLQFGRKGQRHTLAIGKRTEIGGNLYILSLDQGLIHVVSRDLLDAVAIDLDRLRSPRLFSTAIFEVTSWNIQVRENASTLRARFSRQGDSWIFETPIRARADSPAVNTLLNRCLSLEAQSIVAASPSDLSPYGLQNALYRIAVESSQGREVLEIGNLVATDSPFRYAKREDRPTVFQLRIDFLDLLANAQTKLRQRRIFEIDATAATTVTIERRDAPTLTLQKLETGSWEVLARAPGDQGVQTFKGDTAAIAEALAWLDKLQAVPDTGFINDAPSAPDLEAYGLEVPEFSIAITSSRRHTEPTPLSAPVTETLLIGDRAPQDRQESFVKIASKDYIYSVYNDLFETIDNQPERYRERRLVDLPPGTAIKSIEISRLADGAIIATYDLSTAAPPDPQGLALAQLLSSLSAASFLPGPFSSNVEVAGRSRPWSYKLTAQTERAAAPAEPIELYLSETTGGPVLIGGSLARNARFRFKQDFIDAFSPIVFNRAPRERPQDPFSAAPLPPKPAPTPEEAPATTAP